LQLNFYFPKVTKTNHNVYLYLNFFFKRGYIIVQREEFRYIKRRFSNEEIFYNIGSRTINYDTPQTATKENTFYLPSFTPDAPLKVYFDPTYRCNLRCRHCITSSSPDIDSSNELDLFQMKQLFRQLASIGVLEIAITGGEPFLYPHIFEIIGYIQDSTMNLTIASNGTLITATKAKRLADLKVHDIKISVDGYEPVHDDIRGKGSYRRAMSGIRNLVQAGVPVSVRMTLTRNTHEGLEDMFKDLNSASIKKLKVAMIKKVGNATLEENSDLIGCQATEDVVQFLMDLGKSSGISIEFSSDDFDIDIVQGGDKKLRSAEHCTCGAGFETAYISPCGDVLACSSMPNVIMGNIKDSSFIEIWNAHTAEYYRTQALLFGKRQICKADFISLWLQAGTVNPNEQKRATVPM
jgi:MoaA/NifB/PqqE/SkfB family radical SAM enzyme